VWPRPTPAVPRLRSFETFAVAFAALLVVAVVYALVMLFVVMHRNDSRWQPLFGAKSSQWKRSCTSRKKLSPSCGSGQTQGRNYRYIIAGHWEDWDGG
jgi:hypothetical protein